MTDSDGQEHLASVLLDKHNLSQLDLIGNGGMGQVYKAFDSDLDRWVAVKVIRPEAVSTDDAFKRFAAEMRTLAGIRHPGVINIHYSGRSEDTAGTTTYFVMDYVPGGDLEDAISARRASGTHFCVAEVDEILRPVAQALDYLHRRPQPVIHRDLKPANILMPADPGTPSVLTDFGISIAGEDTRMTSTGLVIGTEKYMAPEIFTVAKTWGAHEVDYSPATDRYALALIAVEMMTLTAFRDTMSQRAWRGERILPALTDSILAPRDTRDATMAERLTGVFRTALNNDPSARYDGAVEFLDALRAAAQPQKLAQTRAVPVGGGPPPQAAPQRPQQRPAQQQRPQRRTGRTIGVLVTIVLLAAGTGLLGVLGYRYVLYPEWDNRDAGMVHAFPDLLPDRQNQDGWLGMECSGASPKDDEVARVVCSDSSMSMAVTDFGDSDTRSNFVSGSAESVNSDDCVVRIEQTESDVKVFPDNGYKTRYALALSGSSVEQADPSSVAMRNIPVC